MNRTDLQQTLAILNTYIKGLQEKEEIKQVQQLIQKINWEIIINKATND